VTLHVLDRPVNVTGAGLASGTESQMLPSDHGSIRTSELPMSSNQSAAFTTGAESNAITPTRKRARFIVIPWY